MKQIRLRLLGCTSEASKKCFFGIIEQQRRWLSSVKSFEYLPKGHQQPHTCGRPTVRKWQSDGYIAPWYFQKWHFEDKIFVRWTGLQKIPISVTLGPLKQMFYDKHSYKHKDNVTQGHPLTNNIISFQNMDRHGGLSMNS